MIVNFLIGLLAAVATMAVITVALVSGKWLKGYVQKKLKNREKHKVAFADTREIVDEYLKEKAESASEISMDELEKMCEATPYVAAVVDENGEINEYEGIKGEDVNKNFGERVKEQKGMIICGV